MPLLERLIYVINLQTQPSLILTVVPYLTTIKKNGYGKLHPILHWPDIPTTLLSAQDYVIREIFNDCTTINSGFLLEGRNGANLLTLLLDTQRCYFVNHRLPPLRQGTRKSGQLIWVKEGQGKQRLRCHLTGSATIILPLNPLWYIEPAQQQAGKIDLAMDPEIVTYLLSAPPMSNEEIQHIYGLIKNAASDKQVKSKLHDYLAHFAKPYTEQQIEHWYCDWQATSSQKQWFEFEIGITIEGKRINLLPALAELIQSQLSIHGLAKLSTFPDNKTFELKLSNGKLLTIPMHRLRKILTVLTELYEEDSLQGNQKLRLSRLRALQLNRADEALGLPQLQWYGDISIKNFALEIQTVNTLPLPTLPKTFQGKLRHYQLEGVRWLQFLCHHQLSGILADDMGLGKTAQILTHLLLEKTHQTKLLPSLIIAPTSLVLNWQHEAQRFTPTLKLLVLHGQQRKFRFNEMTNCDLIITTYPLLTRDADILLAQQYHLVILDEAQYIKNIHSKAGQIVRKLSGQQRICLTGTPIENHLGELWSLFHFLLPGLLGDRQQFQRLFRIPIEKQNHIERQQILRHRIAPFFLRRTKNEVLPELPQKIEMLRPVPLTDAQQELYENLRVVLHHKVLMAIQAEGLAKNKIFMLDALLKLRQICCDPRLLKLDHTTYDFTHSAKLQLLMELLPHLIEQGRRILLFSQFVSMIELIQKECDQLKLPYTILTGKTQNRQKVITDFQEGVIPLFLISLKAGGVGLNLTAADTVIHYDPWWNPAVENQATDRAHRIGQNKTVFVYKLFTMGTVEEKILALQQEKQSLFDKVLTDTPHPIDTNIFSAWEQLFGPVN